MKTITYKAGTRGHFQNEWLNSHFSFSFADYFDRARMNFGALRVLNDDIIQPSSGFGKHPHDNMEIITIPLSGTLTHKDSMGNEREIKENEIQVMSAGTGIFHSEYNASPNEFCSILQIWIYPNLHNTVPLYDQKYFDPIDAENKWQLLVNGNGSINESLTINQNSRISRLNLISDKTIEYQLNEHSYGSFVFLISGEIQISGEILKERDSMGIYQTKSFNIKAIRDSYLINIEIPEK